MKWAVSLWMFFGGPLVWWCWISLRLDLVAFQTLGARLLPRGLVVLLAFFLLHGLNLLTADRGKFLARHYLNLGFFAVLGTFVFLSGPVPEISLWFPGAAWGALAGVSLIGLFYPLCSVLIYESIFTAPAAVRQVLVLNRASFFMGLGAFIASVLGTRSFLDPTLEKAAGLIFPLVMSGLLLRKSEKKLLVQSGGYAGNP